MNKTFYYLLTALIIMCSDSVFAQNKDIEKGKEILRKAFTIKDAAKKNETIQLAVQSFTKGGMKREMNLIIGDAFLNKNDLVQATNYYNRCDKAEKNIGLVKVADIYVEQAFEDAKNEAKLLKNAMNLYTKATKAQQGAKSIGDKYFERGEYDKALEYYAIAQDTTSAEKVADTYISKGGDDALKAVDILKKIGTKAALKKAGDLCFDKKQYDRAYDCYSIASLTEGLRKTADKYNEIGKTSEAANVYIKLAESYMKTANTDAVEKLGRENVQAMNYDLASKIFDRAGNMTLARKYLSYQKFMEFDFDSAKLLMIGTEDEYLAKAIDANIKYLDILKTTNSNLMEYANNQPSVVMEVDPNTGKFRPALKVESILIEYYKNIKEPIVDYILTVSRNVTPINNANLKQMMIKRFNQYPAVGKILDPNTFAPRLSKSTTSVKDVYLK